MVGSRTSAWSAFQARSVPTSLCAINRDQPATSANAIAARRLVVSGTYRVLREVRLLRLACDMVPRGHLWASENAEVGAYPGVRRERRRGCRQRTVPRAATHQVVSTFPSRTP